MGAKSVGRLQTYNVLFDLSTLNGNRLSYYHLQYGIYCKELELHRHVHHAQNGKTFRVVMTSLVLLVNQFFFYFVIPR